MRRSIGTAAAAFAIFIGSSMVSVAAETGGAPSAGEKVPARLLRTVLAVRVQHTIPIHRRLPRLEWNRSGSEMGSDTSTHNPAGKKD